MKRPDFPKRVVVTAGMPYGNKPLHIGHVGAIFMWADCYARYLRDCIGHENVLYISGTDGYGSGPEEKFRELKAAGNAPKNLHELVEKYHNIQKDTLDKYEISINFFASCLEPAYSHHKKVSDYFFERMLASGFLEKRTTEQFYDQKLDVILNGRQVEGRCPIVGCKAETGYADECSLGHQYLPKELIEPVSKLSGEKPVMRSVVNYYLKLEPFREEIRAWCDELEAQGNSRKFMLRDMREFLQLPTLFISDTKKEALVDVLKDLPSHVYVDDQKNQRILLKFDTVAARDEASKLLNEAQIRCRYNKVLAPARISGNVAWGMPMPKMADGSTDGLTFYVWPESLWAPVSFTQTYLSLNPDRKGEGSRWQDWWCSKDAKVVQFIGEDNIFFYCLAQTGIWLAVQAAENGNYKIAKEDGRLNLTQVVANKHLLIDNSKVASSGAKASPTADSLLEHYTNEQLRTHFLGQAIGNLSANFRSKVYSPDEFQKSGDPVVFQSLMLTNIFNRVVRSVFYTLQQYFDGKLPKEYKVSEDVAKRAVAALEKYEVFMNKFEFNNVITLLDEYFREANSRWADKSKSDDMTIRAQLITDTIHAVKTGILMLHPIAPKGSEMVAEYLNTANANDLFDWTLAEKTFYEAFPSVNTFKFLEPKVDFFKKHLYL